MNFEWDDNKEIINLKKHGINFERAIKVFGDDYGIEEYDYIHSSYYEDRYHYIGHIGKQIIVCVVYSLLNDDTLRIISARFATRIERERYYEKKNDFRRS